MLKKRKVLNMQHREVSPKKAQTETQFETQSSGETTTYYVHGPQGIHAQQRDGDWSWMLQDGLGSVRGVADNELAVQQSKSYDPFGGVMNAVGPQQTMYGYTGEPTDVNGLVHLRERYYNPNMGAFISQDPYTGSMNDPMTLNHYAYVQNNPVNRVDPSGMISIPALNGAMCGDPAAFAKAMNAGMCMAMLQQTPVASPTGVPSAMPPQCISPATPIPNITPTPTPNFFAPTNTPRAPISSLRLPIGDASMSEAILTPYGCDWIQSNGSPLRSRDVNPRCVNPDGTFQAIGGISANVYAPVPEAEVMIVDQNAGGLGQFVAIRIDTQYLPHLGLGSGYLYVGYSHLSQILVSPVTGQPPYATIGSSPIGVTGQTGTNQIHLDIMAFFIANRNTASTRNPMPSGTVAGTESELHLNSEAFFRLGGIGNYGPVYQPQEIDPLIIWPRLGEGRVCG